MLAQAIEHAGTTEDWEAIANALVGQSYEGPFGTCTMSREHTLRCEVIFETVRDGEIEVLRFPGPDALRPSATYDCRDGTCRPQ